MPCLMSMLQLCQVADVCGYLEILGILQLAAQRPALVTQPRGMGEHPQQ